MYNGDGVSQRRGNVLRGGLILLVAGTAYYLFYRGTGIGIPCVFRSLTGWLCPGCGMTHAVVALIEGDPTRAMAYNALLLTAMPVLAVYGGCRVVLYVRRGETAFRPWEVAFLAVLVVICLGYAVVRNMGRTPDPIWRTLPIAQYLL